jgi:Ca-activated chloride channel family protein
MDRNTHLSNGGCMVTADGRTLPLQGASLSADAKAGLVRVTLQQRFFNPHAEPLQVTYQVPLPADAAVSGFSFLIGDERVVGEVDTKKKARERFEEAVLEGRTAALLDQERSSLFTQKVGNIPPGVEVVSELVIDQKLAFLSDGYWEWRFPTVVAPRYLGGEGRVKDAANVAVEVADAPLATRLGLSLSIRDRLPNGARPESPSHALHTVAGVQRFDVAFAAESGASLDRDVVVRWKAGELDPGVEVDVGRPIDGAAAESAYGLVTLVPPKPGSGMGRVPRDLILLLDTSGSMSGAPIAQMQRVAAALVDSLDEHDFLEMISFANSAERWRWRPAKAAANVRKDAQAWLSKLQAGGGTEMRSGILEALKPLRKDAQRQVVLMTDGLIGFESEIVREICERLPAGSRVHTVGIGSGVNRSLTMPSARAGRGVELIIGLDEDPERGAQRIVARTNAPLVTKVEIFGSAVDALAPARPVDLFAGAPALCSLRLKPFGGEVVVRGETASGVFERRVVVKPVERGEGSGAMAKLFAREQVEDLEVEHAAGVRASGEIDARITQLGLDFQISTRLTSWVAVTPEATVDPRAPKRSANVPQELPYGLSAEGLGLRGAMAPAPSQAVRQALARAGSNMPAGGMVVARRSRSVGGFLDKAFGAGGPAKKDAGPSEDDEAPMEAGEAPAEPEPETDKREVTWLRKTAAAPAPAKPAGVRREAASGSGRIPRHLKAKLTRSKGRLVITFTVEGAPIDWRVGLVVVDYNPAKFDEQLTTAAGVYGAGVQLTLVLDPSGLPGDPSTVTISGVGDTLILELTA